MENLKIARIKKHLTQKELAEKIGVTVNTITRYETGLLRPTYGKLIKMADTLGVTVDFLTGRE